LGRKNSSEANNMTPLHLRPGQPDLMRLSHLCWNSFFKRPQHLMSRFARDPRVYFVEEPVLDSKQPVLKTVICPQTGVYVVTPHLPVGENRNKTLEGLLADFVVIHKIHKPILWFYTPMALEFVPSGIAPSPVVYDCMDELSMFHGAPKQLQGLEEHLLRTADLVFTGTWALSTRDIAPKA
jgi:UDP-galactopyranose mutase